MRILPGSFFCFLEIECDGDFVNLRFTMYFRGDRYREYGVYRQRILCDTLQVGYLHALGNVVLAHVRKPVVLVEPLLSAYIDEFPRA